MLKKIMEM